jgi:hypothetical protein
VYKRQVFDRIAAGCIASELHDNLFEHDPSWSESRSPGFWWGQVESSSQIVAVRIQSDLMAHVYDDSYYTQGLSTHVPLSRYTPWTPVKPDPPVVEEPESDFERNVRMLKAYGNSNDHIQKLVASVVEQIESTIPF